MAFFKEDKKTTKNEEKIIDDFNTLLQAYDSLKYKIEETGDQSYDAILPLREDLFGSGQTPDDTGIIGRIKRGMKLSNITKLRTGSLMWTSLDKIEALDGWFEKHSEYTEEFIKELQFVIKCSFYITGQLYKEIDRLEKEMNELKSEVMDAKEAYNEIAGKYPYPSSTEPLTEEKKVELYGWFKERYALYAKNPDDRVPKMRIFALARSHSGKRMLLDTWFEAAEIQRKKTKQEPDKDLEEKKSKINKGLAL